MISILLHLTLAWGYSIKVAKVAKDQHAHSLPPPTTLIGAVVKQLAKRDGAGEVAVVGGLLSSSAQKYADLFRAASSYLDPSSILESKTGIGKYWEDPLRYQVLQFQKKKRRGDPKYRFNIVPAGKVYCPGSRLVAGYLVDKSIAEKMLGPEWRRKILDACYGVTCLGAKEGRVSVEDVELNEAKQLGSGEFITRFYHPVHLIQEVLDITDKIYGMGGTYVERFWTKSYIWGEEPSTEEYLIPGTRDPVLSCRMRVIPSTGVRVYGVGDDGLAVPA
ncbi:MAG: type I-A CRISPR-associated protein Cas5a [Nitrososphaerota archaeon]